MAAESTSQSDRAPSHGGAASLWVLHRDPARRAVLAAACAEFAGDVRAASPSDALFADEAALRAVRVILLGVPADPEVELEFAHRSARKLPGRSWILAADRHDERALASLFDALGARLLGARFSKSALRTAVEQALRATGERDSLRLRRYRDALSERFARWFTDVDVPELLRAMDPQLAHVPILIAGERGTGRELLARYVHTFGGDAAGGRAPFAEIDCARAQAESALARAITSTAGARSATVFLAEVDRLTPALQTTLRAWVEYGLPPGVASASRIRWIASTAPTPEAERALDPDLRALLAGLEIAIPPLRERPGAIAKIARATAAAFAEPSGRRPREIAPEALRALALHGWPGNVRELENAVLRALAASGADPLRAAHFGLDGDGEDEPLAMLGALEIDEAEASAEEDALPEAEILPEDAPPDDAPPEAAASERTTAEPVIALSLDDLVAEEPAPHPPAPAREPARSLATAAPRDRSDFEDERSWHRLLASASEAVRAPVESIRSALDALPSKGDGADLRRIESALAAPLAQLDALAERFDALAHTASERASAVDATSLIEELLSELRESERGRGLLVLKELDRRRPRALVHATRLRLALRSLLLRMGERSAGAGDLYVASHLNEHGLHGEPAVRLLLRSSGGNSASSAHAALRLELAACEAVARTARGAFTVSDAGGGQLLVVLDLPAAPESRNERGAR